MRELLGTGIRKVSGARVIRVQPVPSLEQAVAELRAMCRSKNLAVTGKKADLIERLRGYNVADGDDSCEDGWEGR